jgi:hypothetical protein
MDNLGIRTTTSKDKSVLNRRRTVVVVGLQYLRDDYLERTALKLAEREEQEKQKDKEKKRLTRYNNKSSSVTITQGNKKLKIVV